MSKPSPKVDQLRAMREAAYERAAQLEKEAEKTEKATKPKKPKGKKQ